MQHIPFNILRGLPRKTIFYCTHQRGDRLFSIVFIANNIIISWSKVTFPWFLFPGFERARRGAGHRVRDQVPGDLGQGLDKRRGGILHAGEGHQGQDGEAIGKYTDMHATRFMFPKIWRVSLSRFRWRERKKCVDFVLTSAFLSSPICAKIRFNQQIYSR